MVWVESAGGESWTRKEAQELSGKKSEMAEMRSEVPRHAEERRMEGQRGVINMNFTGKEAALLACVDSAGGESSMRKEAEEESGKRSEMQYESMKRPEESESSHVKRLKDTMGSARGFKRDKNIVRPQREAEPKEKARTKPKVEAKDAETGKAKPHVTDAGKPEESVTEAGKAEDSVTVGSGKSAMKPLKDNMGSARGLRSDKNIVTRQREAGSKEKARTKPKVEEAKDAEAGKAKPPVTDAGKPEESVTEAGKAEDYVTVGSGKSAMKRLKGTMGSARGLRRDTNIVTRQREVGSKEKARTKPKVEGKDAEAGKAKPTVTDTGKAEDSVTVGSGKLSMNQEVIGLKCTDNEEILQQVIKYRVDRGGDSFIPDEAEEKEMRAMLKAIQEEMARKKKYLFHWLQKLPAKDEESGKSEAPVTVAGKPEESAMDQEVISDNKESLEQVLKDKLDILDLEEDSNRTTEPAADPNSMTIQDDHVDRGKSALAKKTADEEAKAYALFRNYWKSNHCNDCDHFEQITVLGPMQYTHCTPGMVPFNVAETLQIFSVKLKLTDDNAGGFELPLSVYGMVAVRDNLDYKRNILFSRGRRVAQELTQDDPFLLLTGPSRAIVSTDKVDFEIYLKVKGAAASQDKSLMTCVRCCAGGCGTALCIENILCTLEVCLRTVKPAVQATIVGVQIVRKKELCPSNFRYGGLVACTPRTTADSGGNQHIVLIESKGRKMPQGDFGYVHLWRQVVSVEDGGGLDVVIQAYTESGAVAAEGHVHFTAQNSHVSQRQCIVDEAQINVTVAWSVVPTDMDDVVYNV